MLKRADEVLQHGLRKVWAAVDSGVDRITLAEAKRRDLLVVICDCGRVATHPDRLAPYHTEYSYCEACERRIRQECGTI